MENIPLEINVFTKNLQFMFVNLSGAENGILYDN